MSILVLYIHPIKQGLKHILRFPSWRLMCRVLYIHPIKQGLKLRSESQSIFSDVRSLHTSNKTRIETYKSSSA